MSGSVLVIDDDPGTLSLLETILSRRYQVLTATTAGEAYPIFMGNDVDLVLCDVMMPGESGFDACRKLKGMKPSYVPVILLTALNAQEDRNAGLEAGADDFLSKPFDRRELELRVAAFVRLRKQERLIAEQLLELKDLIALKDDLVGMLVHDLRNPMAAILASLRLLSGSPHLAPDDVEDITLSLSAADKATALLDDLLRVRLLEERKMPLNLKPESLRQLVEETVRTLRPVAEERNVRLEVQAPEDFHVAIDARLVRRALENLVTNAVKYTREDVLISLEGESPRPAIQVADRGSGIPDELKASLFEKYGSVEARLGRQRRGVGLGLYMVRLVAAAHGGTVAVIDRPGGGTVFKLMLGLA